MNHRGTTCAHVPAWPSTMPVRLIESIGAALAALVATSRTLASAIPYDSS